MSGLKSVQGMHNSRVGRALFQQRGQGRQGLGADRAVLHQVGEQASIGALVVVQRIAQALQVLPRSRAPQVDRLLEDFVRHALGELSKVHRLPPFRAVPVRHHVRESGDTVEMLAEGACSGTE